MFSYALLGNPIKHSFSPLMHNTAFEELGIDAEYRPVEITKDQLADTISDFLSSNYKGFNVTMPFKEEIRPFCEQVSRDVELTGSINTVKIENGKLYGYSTDGIGFFNALRASGITPKDKRIILLGAGGAAKAIAARATLEGIKELSIYNRTLKKAEEIVENLGDARLSAKSLEDHSSLKRDIEAADILINATSLGMVGQKPLEFLNFEWLPKDLVVSDLVYHPLETTLLKEARKRNLRTIDGLEMLIHQGAESFKIWTDLEFPLEMVRNKINEIL